jgi:uncharacterized protein with HEPN domain
LAPAEKDSQRSEAAVKKDPRVYLAQILERTERILEYTAEGKDAFFADIRTQDAVIRNFEVIGEAAKRIPEQYRQKHAKIPWRELSGFRDILIHQYEGVSIAAIWRIVERDLKTLRKAIKAILPPLDELEREIAEDNDRSDFKTSPRT